jgi:hypothetical protein
MKTLERVLCTAVLFISIAASAPAQKPCSARARISPLTSGMVKRFELPPDWKPLTDEVHAGQYLQSGLGTVGITYEDDDGIPASTYLEAPENPRGELANVKDKLHSRFRPAALRALQSIQSAQPKGYVATNATTSATA